MIQADDATRGGPRVFLSYRRNDSIEQTNKLDEALAREFQGLGVFIDRRAIAGGQDFQQEIEGRLRDCRVVLVLIGPDWTGRLPDGSNRIEDERDIVRQEVLLALDGLQRGRHVLPVLVGGAAMPAAAQLPGPLQALGRINALPLRSGDDQAGDLRRILARVRAIVDDPLQPPLRPFMPRTFDSEDVQFRALEASFAAACQTLEALMAACGSQASALRHQAESMLANLPLWGGEHPAMALLAHDAKTVHSHLDGAMDSELGASGAVGNLTGAGDLRRVAGDDRHELDMALRLGDGFRAATLALEPLANVCWVYYTSRQRFIHIHPWTHSRVVRWHEELLAMDFYTMGTPGANPRRGVFWTAPYRDRYGKGMMVTVAAPVYRGDDFLGTVAIDLGADLLNDFVSAHPLARGPVFIASAAGDLIAAPGITRSRDAVRRPVAEALPADLAALPVAELLGRPGAWIVGRHLVMVGALTNSDWKLVHVCARDTLS